MHEFRYVKQNYYCEMVDLQTIATHVGTPTYVYSYTTLKNHFLKMKQAFSSINNIICYSIKANSHIAICKAMIREGAGLDVVSGGELQRAIEIGADPQTIVFSGVGKKQEEIKLGLEMDILFFNVESFEELELINRIAKERGPVARISIRVNPDVDPLTHRYISTGKSENKFGLDLKIAFKAYEMAKKLSHVEPVGMHMHIGSQITTPAPYIKSIQKMLILIEEIKPLGITLQYFDLGGGFGIVYNDESPPTAEGFAKAILPLVRDLGMTIILEPGRYITGNAGVLLCQVTYMKEGPSKNFIIVDGAMNDFIRPSLYDAYHDIVPLKISSEEKIKADIVGPVCESADILGEGRKINKVKAGDYIVVKGAGAYGYVMASNYNTRPRPAEVLVNGSEYYIIRERETLRNLIDSESIPDFLFR